MSHDNKPWNPGRVFSLSLSDSLPGNLGSIGISLRAPGGGGGGHTKGVEGDV